MDACAVHNGNIKTPADAAPHRLPDTAQKYPARY